MRKRVYIKPIGIMVSEAMYASIITTSDKREVSISDYVRSAIELKMSQEIKEEKQSTED